ncbi:MAG: SCP2 sterol-binding domain-containing protein [Pseudomonadota bacterium]|nr:SCP2 sterol-binding domain-containing protein [Pseudomonadota bacterium]
MSEKSLIQKLASGPVQLVLDRGVTQSETARALCKKLEGKILQVFLGINYLDIYFIACDERLQMVSGVAESPDAILEAHPSKLLNLISLDSKSLIRSGDLKISGNTEILEDFQDLFHLLGPDLEEELSKFTGDVFAHEFISVLSELTNWVGRLDRTMSRSIGEFISEETRLVVTASELEYFCEAIDELTMSVDRIEARFNAFRLKHPENINNL